jgi:Protein of unknown function (DUF3631)
MIRYEEIAPARAKKEEEPAQEPETARLLDETERYVAAHLVADKHATRVSALFATATHGMPLAFVTFPHLLYASRLPGLDGMKSGKTTGMNVTAALSANPRNAKGTYAALRAKLVSASVQTANPSRTFFHDQIDNVFGLSGQNRGGNPVLTSFLQEGYKAGATDSISRQGVDFEFSLFHPMIMTANATGLPVDILGRCVVVFMDKGIPSRYFSVRESEAEAKSLAAALDVAVKGHIRELTEFRARGIHDKLTQRLLEVWEPLFAVASVLGGQRWLNWCLEAFAAIGLESEQSALSPAQQVLRDCSELLGKVAVGVPNGRQFAEGMALADELKRAFADNDIYSTKTLPGLARTIAESMPVPPKQIRVGSSRMNGYYADDIRRAWEEVRPPDVADARVTEEENPFAVSAVSDSDFDEVFEIAPEPAAVRKSAMSAGKKGEK